MTDILKQSVIENEARTAPSLAASLKETARLRRGFINDWRVEPQSNDRPPVFGVVAPGTAAPAARRSTARRQHQQMFKAWSQDRHE